MTGLSHGAIHSLTPPACLSAYLLAGRLLLLPRATNGRAGSFAGGLMGR